jgi:peptide/nickel transport system permease protein
MTTTPSASSASVVDDEFRRPGMLSRLWRFTRKYPVVPGILLTILIVAGIFAPLLAPHDPQKADLRSRHAPPIWLDGGTSDHILGADKQGRDMLSRVIHGARFSLMFAGIVILISTVFGVPYGLISGYLGGWPDEIMMRVVDVIFALPIILLGLAFVVVFGQRLDILIGLLAFFSWPGTARQVRAETLVLKNQDYVSAARLSGASVPRILFRHILPGVINTVIVLKTLSVGGLIMTEAILSFLGAGVPPSIPAWGLMVADGRLYMTVAWWTTVFPGLAIMMTVIGFNFMGDWLRDHFDPRLRQSA